MVRGDARRLRDKLREVPRGPIRSCRHLAAEGQLRPAFEANSVAPAAATHANHTVVPPGLESSAERAVGSKRRARENRGRRAGGPRSDRRRARLARSSQSGGRSSPAAPMASYPGVEASPALSPDGNLVAFAWPGEAETGPTDIYVKAVASEALRRLTATPDSESSPAWSPDGHSVAFVRAQNGVFAVSQLAEHNARCRLQALPSRGLGTRNPFSSVIGTKYRSLASTRCSSTRWTAAI